MGDSEMKISSWGGDGGSSLWEMKGFDDGVEDNLSEQ